MAAPPSQGSAHQPEGLGILAIGGKVYEVVAVFILFLMSGLGQGWASPVLNLLSLNGESPTSPTGSLHTPGCVAGRLGT